MPQPALLPITAAAKPSSTIPPSSRSSSRQASSLPQTDRRFKDWLVQRGLPSQPLRLERVLNQGRGLLATERIGPRTSLLQIPKDLVITQQVAAKCSPAARLAAEEGFSDWVILAAFLANEWAKIESSDGKEGAETAGECDWRAYVEALPEKTGGVLEWPETQISSYLQGSPLLEEALGRRREVTKVAEALQELGRSKSAELGGLNPDSVFSTKTIFWAFSILFSRCVRLEGLGGQITLVPWADMLNHSTDCTAHIDYNWLSSSVALTTDREYKEGEQVKVSYGQRSGGDLLLSYGFVPKRNRFDTVNLQISVPEDDELRPAKEAALKKRNLSVSGQEFPLKLQGVPDGLIQYAALCATKDVENLDRILGGNIDADLRAEARQLLAATVQAALSKYPQAKYKGSQGGGLESTEEGDEGEEEEQSYVAEAGGEERKLAANTVIEKEKLILKRAEFILLAKEPITKRLTWLPDWIKL